MLARLSRIYASCSPAVVISYAVGAVVAGLAALAYAELGTEFPLAGASFNYVLASFGEFPAWYADSQPRIQTNMP